MLQLRAANQRKRVSNVQTKDRPQESRKSLEQPASRARTSNSRLPKRKRTSSGMTNQESTSRKRLRRGLPEENSPRHAGRNSGCTTSSTKCSRRSKGNIRRIDTRTETRTNPITRLKAGKRLMISPAKPCRSNHSDLEVIIIQKNNRSTKELSSTAMEKEEVTNHSTKTTPSTRKNNTTRSSPKAGQSTHDPKHGPTGEVISSKCTMALTLELRRSFRDPRADTTNTATKDKASGAERKCTLRSTITTLQASLKKMASINSTKATTSLADTGIMAKTRRNIKDITKTTVTNSSITNETNVKCERGSTISNSTHSISPTTTHRTTRAPETTRVAATRKTSETASEIGRARNSSMTNTTLTNKTRKTTSTTKTSNICTKCSRTHGRRTSASRRRATTNHDPCRRTTFSGACRSRTKTICKAWCFLPRCTFRSSNHKACSILFKTPTVW